MAFHLINLVVVLLTEHVMFLASFLLNPKHVRFVCLLIAGHGLPHRVQVSK